MKLYDARDAARHPATRGIPYPMAKWDGKFQKFPQKTFRLRPGGDRSRLFSSFALLVEGKLA